MSNSSQLFLAGETVIVTHDTQLYKKDGILHRCCATRTSTLNYGESTQVHLQVRDSGVGTRGKELGKVFKAFHRADATRSGLHEFATKLVLDKRRLIPLSQVDQYLGLAGRSRNGAEVEFFGRC